MPNSPWPPFPNQLPIVPTPGRWDELHLYAGSRCNRACAFCCVRGEPSGSHTPWTEAVLARALRLVAPAGSLKFYGGEPTLDADNQVWAIRHLRASGFVGPVTVFSNGVRARALASILDADPGTLAVLNHAIATGDGAPPLPVASRKLLAQWASRHPDRVFVSHDFVIPVGRHAGAADDGVGGCFRCWPTLTSEGELRACPFAVEEALPHHGLGGEDAAPARYAAFLRWVGDTLEPEAARQGRCACAVCVERGRPLPMLGAS